jgi:hypothetical protein
MLRPQGAGPQHHDLLFMSSFCAGLFYFDGCFRPVPLALDFVGVTVNNFAARNSMMTEICYNKVGM